MARAYNSEELKLVSEHSPRIHDILSPDEIEELFELFNQALNNKLTPFQLRDLLTKYNIHFTDEQFETLFLKVYSKGFTYISL